jgi:predicted glycosyltransferase
MKIWIDLDNTPHVPFFIPIIRELERRGHRVVLTARDAFQVCELADKKGLKYLKIGRHYGKNPAMKIFGLFWRSAQMVRFCLLEKPAIALSHGSRSQGLLCNLLRIPSIAITDYEHSQDTPLTHSRWLILPEAIPGNGLQTKVERIRHYRGIKEDVYAPEFRPDNSLLEELSLRDDELVVTVRPPASEAHYHNPEADVLLIELMSRICQTPGVRVVLLPRNQTQQRVLQTTHPEWFAESRTIIPRHAVDGLNLLWHSDLVVSGGGTMNREAAALRVPVYSIFRGKTGAVDHMLEQEGRLIMIRSAEEIWTKIQFLRRDKNRLLDNTTRPALEDIVTHIEEIIRIEGIASSARKNTGHA